ncbi:MAG TPA: VTT domain-containing protein [Archangium sp.]|uniref:TVP38/TMEM64 family protein n=1 Tax=Archangium sp. TaxID=1872627 RepID=UPI002E340700|nr:VTT domain-containing protein [Archangium sp.]HEX5748942.1 VTT domain-containing protein [Archangium sp.]
MMERATEAPVSRARTVAGWTALGALLLTAILVPFFLWEDRIHAATTAFLQMPHSRGWMAGVLAGLLAADIVLPVPSSLVNLAAGSLLGLWAGTAVSWVGLMGSSVAGYLLGQGASATALRRLVGHDEGRAARVTSALGPWALVVCRGVPVLAEASVVLAGFNRMPWRRFLAVCALSNLGIAAAYSAIGAYAVDTGSFLVAFAGAVCVPALGFFLTRGLQARPAR